MDESNKKEETYYDILGLSPSASVSEIIAAYHAAKHAFSKESMATYTLFGEDEISKISQKLDEAFHVLSNIERRREYDKELALGRHDPNLLSKLEFKISSSKKDEIKIETLYTPICDAYEGYITGKEFKEIREKRNITIEEVSKTTKIPVKYITAIELDNPENLPARVYLQGFLRNLATFYRLDATIVAKSYLEHLDKISNASFRKKLA